MAGQNKVTACPSPGKRLRQAWATQTVAMPGVFNALVARMAEEIGFQAIYLSGAGLSAAACLPDIGLLTLTEFVEQARTISAATPLPLLCDADTGFGEALNVERTVRQFEAAGVAGIHLEDQQLPKRCGHLSGKHLVESEVMAAKIRAAVAARKDADFIIIARTDARGVTGFEDAVQRARIYVKAGADGIFPEALESADEFAAFAKAVQAPLLANMTEFGKSPNLDFRDLANMGYRMVIYPVTAFRAALHAARATLTEIKGRGHQRELLPQMLTREELYELLSYTGYEERDRAYFGGNQSGQAVTTPEKLKRSPQ
ncbi:MAG TPA: methylisocitrate lyase [Gemmataceae bacterium]|nr:methylisocitrate lyase [Gemmataceae bacterium]